jgi:hypothetical protein
LSKIANFGKKPQRILGIKEEIRNGSINTEEKEKFKCQKGI